MTFLKGQKVRLVGTDIIGTVIYTPREDDNDAQVKFPFTSELTFGNIIKIAALELIEEPLKVGDRVRFKSHPHIEAEVVHARPNYSSIVYPWLPLVAHHTIDNSLLEKLSDTW